MVLCGSFSEDNAESLMTVCASFMISVSSDSTDWAEGEYSSKRLLAVRMTCSAAMAPPVLPPMPSATTNSALRGMRLDWKIPTRSCCSVRSPICCPAQASILNPEVWVILAVSVRLWHYGWAGSNPARRRFGEREPYTRGFTRQLLSHYNWREELAR
jgi:hypothetical protein